MQVRDVPLFEVPFFEGVPFLVKSQVVINYGMSF